MFHYLTFKETSVFLISETLLYLHHFYFTQAGYLSHQPCFYYIRQRYFSLYVLFGMTGQVIFWGLGMLKDCSP